MHICFFNDDYPQQGTGSSVAILLKQLCTDLKREGVRTSIITTHREDDEADVMRYDNVISLPRSYRASLRSYLSLYSPNINHRIAATLNSLKPDIVHAHNIHQYITYDSLRIAHKQNIPVALTLHDAMSFCFGRLATKRYLRSDGKDARVNLLHHIRTAGLQYNPLRNSFIRHHIHRYASRRIAVSHALQEALRQNKINVTDVVHHGIDLDDWHAPSDEIIDTFKQEHSLTDKKIVLFGGRISEDKGAAEALKAIRKVSEIVPNVVLLVVGDRRRWLPLAQSVDPENKLKAHWRCTGWLNRDALKVAMYASDVVTTPSLCLDTFNLMNIEAMAAGKPVISTIFGGASEIIEGGKSGLLCNPGHIEAYTNHIKTLLGDEQLCQKMGSEARKRVETNFSGKHYTQKHLELYSSMYGAKSEASL